MTTLQNSAMLAALNISMWTARKYDKKVSAEVERQHQAKDAGRFNKMLIAKESLETITKISTAARSYHYKMTLPWGDNGERLLPATLFSDYTTAIRDHRNNFDTAVRKFIRDYPQLRADATQRLGSMYDPKDYPDVHEIASRFAIAVEFSPIPVAADFRVNLNDEYVDSIRCDLEVRINNRLKDAQRDCWARMKDVVAKIHERLADKDKTFRDTLIGNAEELLNILPALNITSDKELEGIAKDVRALLVSPDRLRADEGLRSDTAEKAAAILAKFQFVGA